MVLCLLSNLESLPWSQPTLMLWVSLILLLLCAFCNGPFGLKGSVSLQMGLTNGIRHPIKLNSAKPCRSYIERSLITEKLPSFVSITVPRNGGSEVGCIDYGLNAVGHEVCVIIYKERQQQMNILELILPQRISYPEEWWKLLVLFKLINNSFFINFFIRSCTEYI